MNAYEILHIVLISALITIIDNKIDCLIYTLNHDNVVLCGFAENTGDNDNWSAVKRSFVNRLDRNDREISIVLCDWTGGIEFFTMQNSVSLLPSL